SWLVLDKSVPLETLNIHNELDISSSSTTTPYLDLTVHGHPKDNSTRLNILEIVIQLRDVINMAYPNLFNQVENIHNAIVTTNRIKNKMKRKARNLFLENNTPTSIISATSININSGI
ncbi:11815_t:CDS:2, partial [Funneliformis caledonium]